MDMPLTTSAMVIWTLLVAMTSTVRADLTSEYVSHSLLLTCSTTGLAPGADVISIVLSNATSSSSSSHPQHSNNHRGFSGGGGGGERGGEDNTLAWMTSDGVPKFGNGSGKSSGGMFLSGIFDKSEAKHSRLAVLFLQYNATEAAVFTCRIRTHGDQANIETRDYRVLVDPVVAPRRMVEEDEEKRRKEKEEEEEEEENKRKGGANVPLSGSAKDSVKKQSSRDSDRDEDAAVRTGSILQPTVLETGTPMSVVIAMLVLITLLFVITSILLLQKFKERCGGTQPGPYPAHYALAREGLEAWGDPHLGGMGMKGSPSLHTMVGLRSHYSLPRPLQPPPPPPKLLRSKSRESDYAASLGMPPGMNRSFHNYTTPYDAIVHDEDGELSLLNTSSHCDVTPALPPELAAEPTYKVPKVEAEVQTHGQGHSMYVCGVPNGGPSTFELE